MKTLQVGIAMPKGNIGISSIAGIRAIFLKANDFLQQKHDTRHTFFEVKLVGESLLSQIAEGIFTIQPDTTFDECVENDLIFVPALLGHPSTFLPQNQALIEWLKTAHQSPKTEIAAMCTAAFLLAKAGLLDSYSGVTTHWIDAPILKELFPKVTLVTEKIITDENGIYTSGGAFSSFNLVLYVIEKYVGRDVAVWLSNIFEINLYRHSQMPFMIFQNQKTHGDKGIAAAQQYMETHYTESLHIGEIAQQFAFSRRNFIRRFQAATGNSPNDYLQRIRMEAAKRLLETTTKRVSEIIYETGYNDFKTFREVFRKWTGVTPKLYRDRMRR